MADRDPEAESPRAHEAAQDGEWDKMHAFYGVTPLPAGAERPAEAAAGAAAAGGLWASLAALSQPRGGLRLVPPALQWTPGQADPRSAEEVRADAASEQPLSAAQQAALEASSGVSLQAVLLHMQQQRLRPAPPGYPRRAAWAAVPDYSVRFVRMSDDE